MVLIAVLIVMVALVSMVMIIENRSSKNFDYSSKLLMENQAALYFNSAISITKRLLEDDNNNYDAPDDDWFSLPPFRVSDDTIVSMSIMPANARININGLISSNKDLAERTKAAFFEIVNSKGDNADKMYSDVIDWMKPNSNTGYAKKVRSFYSLKEIDYVKGLKGFSQDFHNYFTVVDTKGKINVNFAPVDVIEAYLPEIGDCAEDIAKYRKNQPFKNVTQLRDVGCMSDEGYLKILPYVTTLSSFFDVRVDVKIGDEDFQAKMLMERAEKHVKIIKYFEGKGFYE